MPDNIKPAPIPNASLAFAIAVVKFDLEANDIDLSTKVAAIERVASMETHNSVTKDELVNALRWLFDHYDFSGV